MSQTLLEAARNVLRAKYNTPEIKMQAYNQLRNALLWLGHEQDVKEFGDGVAEPSNAFTLLPDTRDPKGYKEFGACSECNAVPGTCVHSTPEYMRAVIMAETAQWLSAQLCIRKLELLKEKRHYLRTRGSATHMYVGMLADIEREVAHINALQDALS